MFSDLLHLKVNGEFLGSLLCDYITFDFENDSYTIYVYFDNACVATYRCRIFDYYAEDINYNETNDLGKFYFLNLNLVL